MPLMSNMVLFSVSNLVFVGIKDSTYVTITYCEINYFMFNALCYWHAEQKQIALFLTIFILTTFVIEHPLVMSE